MGIAGSAQAATSAQIVQQINAQRTANGLPGPVVENPAWSNACRLHNDYQAAFGGVTHEEDPASPAFTPDGAFAGANGVVAPEPSWGSESPWFDAPIHLHQLLSPQLALTGVDDHGGYQCAITIPGWTRTLPGEATLWSYPGDRRSHVKTSEIADEEPFTPGDHVGLPRGTRTGPHLLVFGNDTTQITTATLKGPTGNVEVRWIDNTTADVGEYITLGGIVVPVKPLRDDAVYTASVTATIAGDKVTRTWRFGTGDAVVPAESKVKKLSAKECRTLRLSAERSRVVARRAGRISRQRKLLARARSIDRKVKQLC